MNEVRRFLSIYLNKFGYDTLARTVYKSESIVVHWNIVQKQLKHVKVPNHQSIVMKMNSLKHLVK